MPKNLSGNITIGFTYSVLLFEKLRGHLVGELLPGGLRGCSTFFFGRL
jgi:hypothetical protein